MRTSRNGPRVNYLDMHNGFTCVNAAVQQETPDGNEALQGAREKLQKALDQRGKRMTELGELDAQLGPKTVPEFLQHAHDVVEPAFQKYNSLFSKTVGPGEVMPDLIRMKRAFASCKLSDPMYLATEPRDWRVWKV